MNQITTQLNRIIARLKLNEKLSKVKFIREHGNHSAEVNLTEFLAVVAVTDTSLSKSLWGLSFSHCEGRALCGKGADICLCPVK